MKEKSKKVAGVSAVAVAVVTVVDALATLFFPDSWPGVLLHVLTAFK